MGEAVPAASPLPLCFAGKRLVTPEPADIVPFLPTGAALIGVDGSVFERVTLAAALSEASGIPFLAIEQFLDDRQHDIFAGLFGEEAAFDAEAFRAADL